MPYKISGNISEEARVIIFDESDWSIESNTVISGGGNYEIEVKDGDKTIVSRTNNGWTIGYGAVTAAFYEPPFPLFSRVGAESVFNSDQSDHIATVMLDSTHVFAVFRDVHDSMNGVARIGTITGNVVTWGTPEVFNAGNSDSMAVVMIDSTHVFLTYFDVSRPVSRRVTIAGDNMTFGAEYAFNSSVTARPLTVALVDSTHAMITYKDFGSSQYGRAVIATISGDTISYGAEAVLNSEVTSELASIALDSTHVLVSYRAASAYVYAAVGTITGTTIVFGSEYVITSSQAGSTSALRIDGTHAIVSYSENGNGYSVVGTIANDDEITWETPVVFNTSVATGYVNSVTVDAQTIMVVYSNYDSTYKGTFKIGSLVGNAITFGSSTQFSGDVTWTKIIKLDATHLMVSYSDVDNAYYGTSVILY